MFQDIWVLGLPVWVGVPLLGVYHLPVPPMNARLPAFLSKDRRFTQIIQLFVRLRRCTASQPWGCMPECQEERALYHRDNQLESKLWCFINTSFPSIFSAGPLLLFDKRISLTTYVFALVCLRYCHFLWREHKRSKPWGMFYPQKNSGHSVNWFDNEPSSRFKELGNSIHCEIRIKSQMSSECAQRRKRGKALRKGLITVETVETLL
jgi:hypothetical protein